MARLPRLTLAGQVHFVLLRGNNGQPVVMDDADREVLLDLLGEQARQHQVALHGYVLGDAQWQALLTPVTVDALPRMMQAVGRRYVRYFNNRHGRSGTLWEGRYRSTLIQPERHLLEALVYLDGEPVRENRVDDPAAYRWSSHRHHIGQTVDRRVSPHPLYWSLGNTPFAREAAYANAVHNGLSTEKVTALSRAVWNGWVLGDPAFVAGLQEHTPRRLSPSKAGRPKKAKVT